MLKQSTNLYNNLQSLSVVRLPSFGGHRINIASAAATIRKSMFLPGSDQSERLFSTGTTTLTVSRSITVSVFTRSRQRSL